MEWHLNDRRRSEQDINIVLKSKMIHYFRKWLWWQEHKDAQTTDFMLLTNLKMTLALQLFAATMNSSYNITAEYVFVLTLNTYLVLIWAKQVRILDLATHTYKHK